MLSIHPVLPALGGDQLDRGGRGVVGRHVPVQPGLLREALPRQGREVRLGPWGVRLTHRGAQLVPWRLVADPSDSTGFRYPRFAIGSVGTPTGFSNSLPSPRRCGPHVAEVEPLLEIAEVGKDVRKEKVEQTPQLGKVVLQGSARQQELVRGLEVS